MGYSMKETEKIHAVQWDTICKQRRSIIKKLDCRNITNAVKIAAEKGIVRFCTVDEDEEQVC